MNEINTILKHIQSLDTNDVVKENAIQFVSGLDGELAKYIDPVLTECKKTYIELTMYIPYVAVNIITIYKDKAQFSINKLHDEAIVKDVKVSDLVSEFERLYK